MKRAILFLLLAVCAPIAVAQGFSIDFDEPEYHGEESAYTRVSVTASGTFSGPVEFTLSQQLPGRTRFQVGTRILTPAQPSEAIDVYVYGDDVYSDTHHGFVEIAYTPPGSTQRVVKTAPLTITDDDPPPTISFDDLRMIESDAGDLYVIGFTMTPRATVPIHIVPTASGGTATPGDDYVLVTTSYTIAPQATRGSIVLSVVDDGVPEDTEYFYVGCADRCQPGTVTIIDEAPKPFIAPDQLDVLVGELFELEIVIPEEKSGSIDASLVSSDGSIVMPVFRGSPVARIERGQLSAVVGFMAMNPGDATVDVTFPSWTGLPPATANIHVFGGTFSVDRDAVSVGIGEEVEVTALLDPAPPFAIPLTIHVHPANLVTVPPVVHVEPGGSGTFTIKGRAPGTANIELRTATDRLAALVSVQVAPPLIVTAVAPASGSTNGGTNVTITGSGFKGACGVSFGTAAAKSVTIVSETSLRAVTPPHPAGITDVTVSCGGNQQTLARAFTFTKPARSRSVRK